MARSLLRSEKNLLDRRLSSPHEEKTDSRLLRVYQIHDCCRGNGSRSDPERGSGNENSTEAWLVSLHHVQNEAEKVVVEKWRA